MIRIDRPEVGTPSRSLLSLRDGPGVLLVGLAAGALTGGMGMLSSSRYLIRAIVPT